MNVQICTISNAMGRWSSSGICPPIDTRVKHCSGSFLTNFYIKKLRTERMALKTIDGAYHVSFQGKAKLLVSDDKYRLNK